MLFYFVFSYIQSLTHCDIISLFEHMLRRITPQWCSAPLFLVYQQKQVETLNVLQDVLVCTLHWAPVKWVSQSPTCRGRKYSQSRKDMKKYTELRSLMRHCNWWFQIMYILWVFSDFRCCFLYRSDVFVLHLCRASLNVLYCFIRKRHHREESLWPAEIQWRPREQSGKRHWPQICLWLLQNFPVSSQPVQQCAMSLKYK